MGCFRKSMSSGESYTTDSRNPNPLNYEIQWCLAQGDFLLARVKYFGCTNYEGDKLLLFFEMTEKELRALRELDPHFTEKSKLIGRFKPDAGGEALAMWLIKNG